MKKEIQTFSSFELNVYHLNTYVKKKTNLKLIFEMRVSPRICFDLCFLKLRGQRNIARLLGQCTVTNEGILLRGSVSDRKPALEPEISEPGFLLVYSLLLP
jgi:hypothetical protein